MPYVQRDQAGNIVWLSETYVQPPTGVEEELPADHPEVVAFIARTTQDVAEESSLKQDGTEVAWLNWTKTDVSTFVENNATTLAGVRVILKRVIWFLIVCARRHLRG